jgi:hypothetical protein
MKNHQGTDKTPHEDTDKTPRESISPDVNIKLAQAAGKKVVVINNKGKRIGAQG